MNRLNKLPDLHNSYFVMRHGNSLANKQGIILSGPADGTTGYGLTDEGKEQVLSSASEARTKNILDNKTVIISSDFLRAKETANIAAKALGVKKVEFTDKLRERFFGDWEKTDNKNYQKVWDDDGLDHNHKNDNVESVSEVLERAISLIKDLESKYSNRNILLVSHGDTLQILQTAFKKVSPAHHRRLTHLQTAEIRRLEY